MQTHRESPSISGNGYGQKLDPFGRPMASLGAGFGAGRSGIAQKCR